MADTVSIFNMALSHVGVGAEVQSTTEDTTEAAACRRFFDQCRDELLAEFPWPFATVTTQVALVESDPTSEWAYAYRYPSDCLCIQRILGGSRNEVRSTRVPYRVQSDGDGGLLIFTDYADTINGTYLAYTMRVEDPSQWPVSFVRAMAYLLASYIGARVSSGDPMKLADRSAQFAELARSISQRSAANEEQPDELPESEFITARDGPTYPPANAGTFISQFLAP